MISTANRKRVIGLAVTSAMAGALLSGCTTNAAPPANLSASRAEQALANGRFEQAINHAEAAVLAEPRTVVSAVRWSVTKLTGNRGLICGPCASAASRM